MAPETPAIEFQHVSKTFSDFDLRVLDEINFRVKPGEFVCVLGTSGCGKTILLWTAAGFIKPSSGKVFSFGQEIVKPSKERMVIFQEYALFPWRSVLGNVMISLENSNLSQKEKRERAMIYLKMTGLEEFAHWPIHKLSGGMNQKVALARALCPNPKTLLMDEPFAALDVQARHTLRDELLEIWYQTKKTILFVTHGINEAIYLADRIIILSARPALIKKIINVPIPRPRKRDDPAVGKLNEELLYLLKEEFQKQEQARMSKNYIPTPNY